MVNLPRISVVIPLYNKRATVGRAIRSVLSQTVADFEVVVVDDGSTDGGLEVVRAFVDPRIRSVIQTNEGVSAARNRGINESSCDLIAFLDADDEWLSTFLDGVLSLKSMFPEAGIYATSYFLQSSDGLRRERVIRGLENSTEQCLLNDYFSIASRSNPPVHSSSVAAWKGDLLAIGGFPVGVRAGEDLLTWARLAACKPVALFQAPLAVFHQDPGTAGGIPSRIPDPSDSVGRDLRIILETAPAARRPSMRRYVGLWYKMRCSIYLGLGQRRHAVRECAKALLLWPGNLRIYLLMMACALPTRSVQRLRSSRSQKQ